MTARLTDVTGESLSYIGIPLSLCQTEEEEDGHRSNYLTVQQWSDDPCAGDEKDELKSTFESNVAA